MFVLFLLFTISALAQKQPNARFNVNHGVFLNKIDSAIAKKIKITNFNNNTVGVVFPAEYGKQLFGDNKWFAGYTFITPDTDLVKSIDNELFNQYCRAVSHLNDLNWQDIIAGSQDDAKELARIKKDRRKDLREIAKYCPIWRENLKYYDKQYIGYKTPSGEEIIFIQLLDFREDPYHLKPAFYRSWIDGWHGWFETNLRVLHFHVEKKLVTVNED